MRKKPGVRWRAAARIGVNGDEGRRGRDHEPQTRPLGQPSNPRRFRDAPFQSNRTDLCSPGGDVVDVWYTHTAAADGQLIVSSTTDAGPADDGNIGIALFTADGQTERSCDAGEQGDRFSSSSGWVRNALAMASVRAGDTVLIRLTAPNAAAGDPRAGGLLFLDLITGFTNDICAHATEVAATPGGTTSVPYAFTYSQLDEPGSCQNSLLDDLQMYDVWFSFTAPEDGSVVFGAGPETWPLRGTITMLDACGGQELACATPRFDGHPEGELTVSLDMTAGQQVLIRVAGALAVHSAQENFRVTISGACSGADLAEPYGTLDFFDVSAFLRAFDAGDPAADLAAPFGLFDFFDVSAFLSLFGAGCP